ncbi:MAG: sulfotransferase [Fidelibacterota bacterium]
MSKKLKQLTWPLINYLGAQKERCKFSKPPIILGGCARSGTTMLLAIIAAHPAVFAIPTELRAMTNWVAVNSDGSSNFKPSRMDRIYRHFLLHRIPKQCIRWCEKDTINLWYIDKILAYFQNQVKFIHIIRDGRDVVTSKHPKEPDKYWVDPNRWVNDMRIGLKYVSHPSVHTIKYEDLVLNFQTTVGNLMDFIGEEFHPNLNLWHQHTTIKRSKAWFTPVQATHDNSIGRWKKPTHQERIKIVMGIPGVEKMLQQYKYI